METELPKCKICGEPVPPGKTLCWCCEHEPKLGIKKDNHTCNEDGCEIDFNSKE